MIRSKRRFALASALFVVLLLVVSACEGVEDVDITEPDELEPEDPTVEEPEPEPVDEEVVSAGRQSEWFDEQAFEDEMRWRTIEPEGPEGQPWVQFIEPVFADTSEFETEPPWTVCFSNAAVDNPWRVVGWETMQAEVELHDNIGEFIAVDAGGSDAAQISDIEELLEGGLCDVLIVSPNTTEALTPVVEMACEELPVVVFDRNVLTDCPVSFVRPIGGFAYGAEAAEFLVEQVGEGGNILALRILPGVDVLETRFVSAQIILEEAGMNIIGDEFTEGDVAVVKGIIDDYLARGEQIDGVWMDAGATSVAAAEAFEDQGLPVPPITGEDQNDFLTKWNEEGLTAIAPTFPTYQWRTAVIAAVRILEGSDEVPEWWVLPQEPVTEENLDEHLFPDMPPLFYAQCGCQDMPGFPERWQ